jgi:hypothetical protein
MLPCLYSRGIRRKVSLEVWHKEARLISEGFILKLAERLNLKFVFSPEQVN